MHRSVIELHHKRANEIEREMMREGEAKRMGRRGGGEERKKRGTWDKKHGSHHSKRGGG